VGIYSQPHEHTDIVVLTHNGLEFTKCCIHNIQKHTKNYTLIVVDNASSDDTIKYLKKQDVVLIENKTNRGVAGGRNDGLKSGTSEFCICLDNDQYVGEDWLEELFTFIHKGFDTCGVDAWQMNEPTHPRAYIPRKHCQSKYDIPTYIGGGGHLIKRSILDEFNFFDEVFNPFYYEDSDLYFKLHKKGYKSFWNSKHKIKHVGNSTVTSFSRSQQFIKTHKIFKERWFPYFPEPLTICCDIDRILA